MLFRCFRFNPKHKPAFRVLYALRVLIFFAVAKPRQFFNIYIAKFFCVLTVPAAGNDAEGSIRSSGGTNTHPTRVTL